MRDKVLTWEDVKEKLNFTETEKAEIRLEEELIEATILARKKSKLSQRELSKRTNIKQPAIARIERKLHSPNITTLIKILYPMGYTIKVVPIKNEEDLNTKNK